MNKVELVAKYKGVVGADVLLAKALMMSEVSQMSKAEVRMREFLFASWTSLQKKAVKKATSLAVGLKSYKEIAREVDKIMEPWVLEVAPVVSEEMDRIFALALQVGYKKATQQTKNSLNYDLPKTNVEEVKKAASPKAVVELLPDFTLADKQAIDALKDDQLFWIGERYKDVNPRIKETARAAMLESGGSSFAAGRLIKERIDSELGFVRVPGGFSGSREQYYEALAANAATNARVHGQMRSFMSVGVQTYQISAINDKRTCERCSHMHGKVFKTSQGANQMSNVLGAKTPEDVKKAHPWKSHKEITKISPSSGPMKGAAGASDSKKLAEAGLAFPPYHFKCRCTVDISDEIQSYDQLTPMEPPKAKPRKKPIPKVKPKPTPKVRPKAKPKKLSVKDQIAAKMEGHEGLVDSVALEDQVSYRIKQEMEGFQEILDKRLEMIRNDALKELKKSFPKNEWKKHLDELPTRLNARQKGEALEKVFRKEIKVTKGRKYKTIDADSKLGVATMNDAVVETKDSYNQGVKLLSKEELQSAHEMGMQYVDDRVYKKAKDKMPFVFKTKGDRKKIKGGFHWMVEAEGTTEKQSAIVISNYKEAIVKQRYPTVMKHEFGHFLDTIGRNGEASVIARNKYANGGKLLRRGTADTGYYYIMRGRYGREYAGRVYAGKGQGEMYNTHITARKGRGQSYGGKKASSEYGSTAAELLEPNVDFGYAALGLEWTHFPERLAFLKAFLKGRFV